MIGSTAFVIGYGSTPTRRQTDENVFEGAAGSPKKLNGESEENKQKSSVEALFDYILSDIYIVSISFYAFWTLCGVLWYKYYWRWTWATAYYYTMDAGLSIGFCSPAEKDDWSKLFTIVYVLVGSSVVSGCLGLFATSVFSNKVTLVQVAHEFGAIGFQEDGVITVKSVIRCLWYHFKYFIGWYSNRARTIVIAVFVGWMGLGTTYGMVFENWSFITSLYWAITTSSTGGLQSAPCESGDEYTCSMGNVRGTLMGVFMMIGVPLYAAAIGQFAHLAVGRAIAAREEKMLRRPIEDAEFIFAANILSPEGSETLVLGEYILLELMRLGQTNQHQIELMKKRYYELDKEKRGELDIWDLQQSGRVVPRKLSSIEMTKRIRSRSLELFGFSPTSLKQANATDGFTGRVAGAGSGKEGTSSRRMTKKSFIKSYRLPDLEDGDTPNGTTNSATQSQIPFNAIASGSPTIGGNHFLHKLFESAPPTTPPSSNRHFPSPSISQREKLSSRDTAMSDNNIELNREPCFSDFDFIREEDEEDELEIPQGSETKSEDRMLPNSIDTTVVAQSSGIVFVAPPPQTSSPIVAAKEYAWETGSYHSESCHESEDHLPEDFIEQVAVEPKIEYEGNRKKLHLSSSSSSPANTEDWSRVDFGMDV